MATWTTAVVRHRATTAATAISTGLDNRAPVPASSPLTGFAPEVLGGGVISDIWGGTAPPDVAATASWPP